MNTCCGKSASGGPCGCGPTCPEKTTKDEGQKLLTADEARAQVGRAVCKNLAASIAANEAEIEKLADGPTKENAKVITQAGRELHDSILLMVKKIERPLILRPDRARKVTRLVQ
jgi:hypothetical protein